MSKGGSSSPQPTQTSSTMTQTDLPEYAKPFYLDMMKEAQAQAGEPYQPFPGQRIGGFGADTTAGFNQLRNITASGAPGAFTTAEGALTGVATGAGPQQQGQFGPTATTGVLPDYGSFTDQGVANQFMNPYIREVLDAQQLRLGQRFNRDQLGRDQAAVEAGAFGNTRRGVERANAQRELDIQRNELDAQGYAAAYLSGADIFGQERDANLQNRLMGYDVLAGNRQADLANRALNTEVFAGNQARELEAQRNRMGAAESLTGQGLAAEGLFTDRARTRAGIGGAYDELAQSGLDVGYTDFLNQRDWERKKLGDYSGLLRGVPISPTQESTTYQVPPSPASQLLGLGTTGLGLYKAYTGSD